MCEIQGCVMNPMQVFPTWHCLRHRGRLTYGVKTSSRDALWAALDTSVGYSPRHRWDSIAGTTILYHLCILRRTQALHSADQGRGCWSTGNATRRGRRTVYWTTGQPEQREPLPNTPAPQDPSGTTGLPGAADAAADSARAAVHSEGQGSEKR